MQIVPFESEHFSAVVQVANQIHGDNYANLDAVVQMHKQGNKKGINASFVALDSQQNVVGYRISFAAGNWRADQWCSQEIWPVSLSEMAYFKSVAVLASKQGQGIGSKMLAASTRALKKQGAKAGLAHIWRESPGNSAERYFIGAGGRLLVVHPNRWQHLSETAAYSCPLCDKLCRCSAGEMVLTF
ncbi:GNAT family N-acetyltransferase [Rheinheimera sp. WS51]|uniref:GNAT family N-acetyltransferase n=1 Tax=Rheinheimera sp. WS51 TaxID=3425886 RepID=UPI003D8C3FB0